MFSREGGGGGGERVGGSVLTFFPGFLAADLPAEMIRSSMK